MKVERNIGKDTVMNDDYKIKFTYKTEKPDLRGPKYLECTDLFGNTWYKNLWTGEDLPIGAVPLDLYNYEWTLTTDDE